MNWLTQDWYKERDDGGWTLRSEYSTYGSSYIGRIQDLDIADHIVWIHNSLMDYHKECHSGEGTHMLRHGIPIHMTETGDYYPCLFSMFGLTQEALIEMMKKDG